MPDSIIVENCSPTLAGIKTGNIFTVDRSLITDIKKELCELNKCFTQKGLRVIPLRVSEKNVLLYVYRPDRLREDLSCKEARCILLENGYSCNSIEKDIVHLIHQIHNSKSFPHEIGLFLGYPPEDVAGFMYKGADRAKCVGAWKVYGDEYVARQKFDMFKRCTRAYCSAFKVHHDLEKLIVN